MPVQPTPGTGHHLYHAPPRFLTLSHIVQGDRSVTIFHFVAFCAFLSHRIMAIIVLILSCPFCPLPTSHMASRVTFHHRHSSPVLFGRSIGRSFIFAFAPNTTSRHIQAPFLISRVLHALTIPSTAYHNCFQLHQINANDVPINLPKSVPGSDPGRGGESRGETRRGGSR